MPVNIPHQLPARELLESENIFVMSDQRASHQDIRPLRIAIANLMPTMIDTETQLLRLLSNTPLQVEITLIRMGTHNPTNTSHEHLNTFYKTFEQAKDERFDGLVVTGAPLGHLDYEDVNYWEEFAALINWSSTNCFSTMHLCWAAHAALYLKYGLNKRRLPAKAFGVFDHQILDAHARILRGFDETFRAPHSRHTEVPLDTVSNEPELKVLAQSNEVGAYLLSSKDDRNYFLTGHPEYERDTLAGEYHRDISRGLDIALPVNYFKNNDPKQGPVMTWRSHGHLLYANWLNYCVYQETPFDLAELR